MRILGLHYEVCFPIDYPLLIIIIRYLFFYQHHFLISLHRSFSAWSEEGCHIHLTNRTHTVCECNHLTNFAVLMDVHAVKLDTAHQVALQIITYVGCIISVICLVLAILTFHLFRGLKVRNGNKDKFKIMIHKLN